MDPNGIQDKRTTEARRIKAKVIERGLRFADIDRSYRLPEGTARQTLREPNLAGERAIAAALRTKPELLWRTRYHASGQRRPRQDWSKVRLTESPNGAAA